MPKPPRHPSTSPSPPAVEVRSDDMLCRVEFWTEDEWAALPEAARPRERAHAPGRGWFGLVPVAGLN